MRSSKRRHERGASLSLRPHKTPRYHVGDEHDATSQSVESDCMSLDGDGDGGESSRPSQPKTIWDKLELLSPDAPVIVPCLTFLSHPVRPLCTFDISSLTAWPTSLAAIRGSLVYNATPQCGPILPIDIQNLTAWRRMTTDHGSHVPPTTSKRGAYLHLGFTAWLHIDVFVVLPNLASDAHHRMPDSVLETWTDKVFLPATSLAAPTSWRASHDHAATTSDDDTRAPYPTYTFDGGTHQLEQLWWKMQVLSEMYAEFRAPELVMFMARTNRGVFTGASADAVWGEFEVQWMKEIDTRFLPLDGNSLRVTISSDVVM